MAGRTVEYKIAVTNAEEAIRKLQDFGAGGERAFRRIVNAAKDADKIPGSVKATDAALGALRGSLDELAARAGVFGTIAQAAGPLGLTAAAAAGLGGALVLLAKNAADSAGSLVDLSDLTGVATETLQAYRIAAAGVGLEQQQLDQAFQTFGKNLGDVELGTGKLSAKLKALDPDFLQLVKNAGSTEEAFDLVIQKIGELPTQAERAALATAAFGAEGAKLALVGGTVDEVRGKYEAMGAVIGDDLVRAADAAGDALDEQTAVLRAQIDALTLQATPAILAFETAWVAGAARIVNALTEVLETIGLIDESVDEQFRELSVLRNQKAVSLKELESKGTLDPRGAAAVENLRREIAEIDRKMGAIRALQKTEKDAADQAATDRKQAARDEQTRLQGIKDREAAEKKAGREAESAAKAAASAHKAALAELERLEDQAATAGLEGIAKLEVERDQAYAHWADLAARHVITEEELARANLAVWQEFEGEKAKITQDEAEKRAKEEARAAEKAARAAEREAEKQARLQEQQAEAMLKPFRTASEDIQRTLSDAIFTALDGGIDDFDDFADTVFDIFKRLASEIATLLIFQPVLGNIAGGNLGSVGGVLGVGGTTGRESLGFLSSISDSVGRLFDYFSTGIFSSDVAAITPGLSDTIAGPPTASVASGITGAGAAGALGSLAASAGWGLIVAGAVQAITTGFDFLINPILAAIGLGAQPTRGTVLRSIFEDFIQDDDIGAGFFASDKYLRGVGQRGTRDILARDFPEDRPGDFVLAMRQYNAETAKAIGLTEEQTNQVLGLAAAFRAMIGEKAGHEEQRTLAIVADILGSIEAEGASAAESIEAIQAAVAALGDPREVFRTLERFAAEGGDINPADLAKAYEGLADAIFGDLVGAISAADLAAEEFAKTGAVDFETLEKRVANVVAAGELLKGVLSGLAAAVVTDPSRFFSDVVATPTDGGESAVYGRVVDQGAIDEFHDAILVAFRDATVQGLTQGMVEGLLNPTVLEPFMAASQDILARLTAGEISGEEAGTLFAAEATKMEAALAELDPFLRDFIKSLGILGDAFNDLLEDTEAVIEAAAGFNASITDQILQLTNPDQAERNALTEAQRQRRQNAESIAEAGGFIDFAELTRLEMEETAALERRLSEDERREAERAHEERLRQIEQEQDAWERAQAAVRDLITSLTATPASPLPPSLAFGNAQAEFDRLLTGALAGDTEALEDLPAAAQALLGLAETLFGSTADFFAIFDDVLADLEGVGSRLGPAIPPGDLAIIDALEQQTRDLIAAGTAPIGEQPPKYPDGNPDYPPGPKYPKGTNPDYQPGGAFYPGGSTLYTGREESSAANPWAPLNGTMTTVGQEVVRMHATLADRLGRSLAVQDAMQRELYALRVLVERQHLRPGLKERFA